MGMWAGAGDAAIRRTIVIRKRMTGTANRAGFEIGVDIGGTFTDIVCRQAGGALRVLKVPSTRHDLGEAVIKAIAELGEPWGIRAADVSRFGPGPTPPTHPRPGPHGPR